MVNEKFRLPGSSYDELTKILQAYSVMRGPVGPAEVARPIGIDPTIVSRNSGFLVATGLVEGGHTKAVTARGAALARALQYTHEEDIRRHWRQVVLDTEFLRQLVAWVRIRNGMEAAALISHVAYLARQPSSGPGETGAAAIVEILRVAGALQERDGKLVATSFEDGADERDSRTRALQADDDLSLDRAVQPEFLQTRVSESVAAVPSSQPDGIIVQINVNVDCSVDDLPRLAELLVELRETVARPQPSATDSD